ncbi:MAG: HepT-like ribonuclease domain-containing protein [Candidatus Limnocylindria bacterium]
MASRTRWYLEQAKQYAVQAIEGRRRLGTEWTADPVDRAGLTHLVEAVAEYLGHVPDKIREGHPRVPWREIAGMRTIAAHAYHQIDERLVEATIMRDLPDLLREIEAMLGGLDSDADR